MLLQIRGNAETLDSIVTALSQILGCPCPKLIHTLIQQRPKLYRVILSAIPEVSRAILEILQADEE